MRNTSFLGKLLALTESTNKHEANLAKAKLEEQLEKRGIDLDELEQQLGDMSVVEEDIEVIAFRYGQPYKRVDPAVSILLGAVADYYNGKIVFTPFKMSRTGNRKHDKEYIKDSNGDIYRQMEITASKARQIEIEIYTDYLVQALIDEWARHCQTDPFAVAMNGTAYRNDFRKNWAWKVDERFKQMKRDEQQNGKQLKLADKTINVSALTIVNANKAELAKVEEFYAERYPTMGSGSGYSSGSTSGADAGSSAGSRVGLSRQMSGNSQRRLGGY